MAKKSLNLVASAKPIDKPAVVAVLQRAIEIIRDEPLNGLQGYIAIGQAAHEAGYTFDLHYQAATAFVNAMNSDRVKIFAMEEAIRKLQ